jgi:hypothetical protein
MRAERQAIGSPAAEGNRTVFDHECSSPPRFPSASALEVRWFCPELLSVMGENARLPTFLMKKEKRRGLRFRSAGRWA